MKRDKKIVEFKTHAETTNGNIIVSMLTQAGKIILATVKMFGGFFSGNEITGKKRGKKIRGRIENDGTGNIF